MTPKLRRRLNDIKAEARDNPQRRADLERHPLVWATIEVLIDPLGLPAGSAIGILERGLGEIKNAGMAIQIEAAEVVADEEVEL